ncbi:MAG: hypothetical protein Q4C47_09785, partial [Planctomycetia bacterium]|nr:hypothetical protein [Planctomycetia bacterium]
VRPDSSADIADRALFPLRLSYIERYFLTDHTVEYPMTSIISVELEGELQREPFESAWCEARKRHPMVNATARYHRITLAGVWSDAGDVAPPITWCDVDGARDTDLCAPIRLPAWGWIDLLTRPGVQAWVRQCDGRTKVTFLVHHACVDGVGILEFIGDLLAAYGMRTATPGAPKPVYTREYDDALLRDREDFLVPRLRFDGLGYILKVLPGWWVEGTKFVFRRTQALEGDRSVECTGSVDPEVPQLHFFEMDADRMKRIDAKIDPSLFSLNDLMLRDLILTLRDWNEMYPSRRSGPLRVDMPMNLRTPDQRGLSAANCVSHTFLRPSPDRFDHPGRLLAEVVRLTRKMVYERAGMMFNSWLRTGFWVPGVVQLMENAGKNFATAVLSNAGNALRTFGARFPLSDGLAVAGDVRIRRVTGVPPVRFGTPAVFCVTRNYRRLSMLGRTDPRIFTMDGGEQLTRMYQERLIRSIDGIIAHGPESAIGEN